jgi:serine/threonine protein kinase
LILGELGKGGMGAVYRAWDEKLRRVVALKRLLGTAEPDAVQRFLREAEAVARLRHPSIVAVHDVGQHEGQPWLAMDLIDGRSLAERLKPGEGKIPLNRALEAMVSVARAVQHAHDQGVIHRDLKPQNIMIDAKLRPFVLDFGLARPPSITSSSDDHLSRGRPR